MLRILVVDDHGDLGKTICKALADRQYAVDVTKGGAEGLCMVNTQPRYDALLLDLNMPDIPGVLVLDNLPPDPPPVILMTGSYDLIPVPTPWKVKHVLLKPFELDELLAVLDDVTKSGPPLPEKSDDPATGSSEGSPEPERPQGRGV